MSLRRWLFWPILVAFLALVAWVTFFKPTEPDRRVACHFGAYRLSDGRVISFSASNGPKYIRYVLMNGQTGRLKAVTGQPTAKAHGGAGSQIEAINRRIRQGGLNKFEGGPGFAEDTPVTNRVTFAGCEDGGVEVSLDGHSAVAGNRIDFDVEETSFESHGLRLAGRLILPRTTQPVPIAVLVHGSERSSALDANRFQHLLPAYGIGVFVYDKRGTGGSEGTYTQNFHLLSDDAVAAMSTAKHLAGNRAAEIGFEGGSQAGWIIPLAARKSKPAFMLIGYGLAEGPLAEDREEVFDGLRRAGFGEDVIEKAREITNATAIVMRSGFKSGFDQLDAVREKYRNEPWYPHVKGEFSGDFLRTPNWLIRLIGPFLDVGTSWEYDPLPALQAFQNNQLWILAGQDTEAPSRETRRILLELQTTHPKLDIVVFENANHGIIETVGAGDALKPVRFSEGYFQLVVDWLLSKRVGASRPDVTALPGSEELMPTQTQVPDVSSSGPPSQP